MPNDSLIKPLTDWFNIFSYRDYFMFLYYWCSIYNRYNIYDCLVQSQRAHDAITTSLLHQNDVAVNEIFAATRTAEPSCG